MAAGETRTRQRSAAALSASPPPSRQPPLQHTTAALLDGGATDDGTAYRVMEVVEGTAIDDHWDVHSVSTSQRLELFLPVGAPVQYAHQHLVIHGDLKPSNIQVTPDGVPKL